MAIVSLLAALWVAVTSLSDVIAALMLDRTAYVLLVRDRQLGILDRVRTQSPASTATATPTAQRDFISALAEPFLKVPRPEAERLFLLLGDVYYERRGVTVPLGLLQLLCCWLLISGSLATLRRQGWGLPMWSFACWAGIFFGLLNTLVTFVHSRTLMSRLGPQAAEVLAKANGTSVELGLLQLWQLARFCVVLRAGIEGLWVLLLGLSALYLQRQLVRFPPQERRGR